MAHDFLQFLASWVMSLSLTEVPLCGHLYFVRKRDREVWNFAPLSKFSCPWKKWDRKIFEREETLAVSPRTLCLLSLFSRAKSGKLYFFNFIEILALALAFSPVSFFWMCPCIHPEFHLPEVFLVEASMKTLFTKMCAINEASSS